MKYEQQMYLPVKSIFEKDYLSCPQVRVNRRKIDIVFQNVNNGELIAVELKLSNWKKALKQAIINKLCSDKSYVALPQNNIKNVDINLFRKYGIGLISVGESSEILEYAIEHPVYKNKYYYYQIQQSIKAFTRK